MEALLPEGNERELEVWVNARWRQEVEAVPDESSARLTETKDDGRRVECRVFATQYIGYARYEVALPHRGLKFGSRPTVTISSGGRTMRPRVKEVGPWNTYYDNYWQPRKHRTMRKGLQRCVPGARAPYFNNHNRGKDEHGREIPKPTGVDLTPAARGSGLARHNNAWVYVKIPWLRR